MKDMHIPLVLPFKAIDLILSVLDKHPLPAETSRPIMDSMRKQTEDYIEKKSAEAKKAAASKKKSITKKKGSKMANHPGRVVAKKKRVAKKVAAKRSNNPAKRKKR